VCSTADTLHAFWRVKGCELVNLAIHSCHLLCQVADENYKLKWPDSPEIFLPDSKVIQTLSSNVEEERSGDMVQA
jgi:hypothetical protein